MKIYKSKIDIAVLILFFCRDEQLKKVFEAVKKARPSKLYLYQDGARVGREDDKLGIMRCREIVRDDNIDWDCEVHRCYQDNNYGCDPSEYMAQKWMFSTEEMGIVLEDDDVPAQSFFPFCKELLGKYKNDTRINIICGMNNLQISDWCPYSYFFSSTGSIWGWATWKRVIDMWEMKIPHLSDEYFKKIYIERYKRDGNPEKLLKHFKKNNDSGIAYYESILGANALSNNMLNIVPTKNLISNIGISQNTTHSVSDLKMIPRGLKKIFFMPTYEIEFPLKHPTFIIEDLLYKKKLNKAMGNGFFISKWQMLESLFLRIRYGDFRGIYHSIQRRIH